MDRLISSRPSAWISFREISNESLQKIAHLQGVPPDEIVQNLHSRLRRAIAAQAWLRRLTSDRLSRRFRSDHRQTWKQGVPAKQFGSP